MNVTSHLKTGLLATSAVVALQCAISATASAADVSDMGAADTIVVAQAANPPPAMPVQIAQAAAGDMPVEQVIVSGRAERQIGVAAAASEGAVTGVDLSTRPILRPGDLLEVVPGLIAAQHSGSGKANQYFLRGINLDHGTDFTSVIDDVPWNFRTHGHGQGYLDVNGLIPEVVDRIDYRKGPYRADLGDFGLAGAAIITTVDGYDHPWIQAEGGSFGYGRLVAGGTVDAAGGKLTLVGQSKIYDGPWELAEHLRHWSGWGKYTHATPFGSFDATLSGYTGTWRPTEQIPERAVGHTFSEPGDPSVPTIDCKDRYCAIDPTATGITTRWIATARLTGDDWHTSVYGQYYHWHMSSNPTFFLDNPIDGDQILQHDRRWIFGGKGEKSFDFSDEFQVKAGLEGRYDDISSVGVWNTTANRIIGEISDQSVTEGSVAPYLEANWEPLERLRLMGGLRYDYYSVDVKALDPVSLSGNVSDSVVSPKAGVAYGLTNYLEFYGNWGQGFHSNDGRGSATNGVPLLVKGTGYEGGARVQFSTFNVSFAYWWLDEDSELEFDGDTNSVEPKGSSARQGWEVVGYWRPYDWLSIDAVYSSTQARFVDCPPGECHIPNAPEAAGELGVSGIWDEYEASVRVRYLGPYPLIEDNSQRSPNDVYINFRVAWKPAPWTLSVELLNAFGDDGHDIQYLYTSRLPGEPADGIDGLLSRAVEPRTVRVGLKYEF
jgi:outer membrane receptor protein involved in Fe transport